MNYRNSTDRKTAYLRTALTERKIRAIMNRSENRGVDQDELREEIESFYGALPDWLTQRDHRDIVLRNLKQRLEIPANTVLKFEWKYVALFRAGAAWSGERCSDINFTAASQSKRAIGLLQRWGW